VIDSIYMSMHTVCTAMHCVFADSISIAECDDAGIELFSRISVAVYTVYVALRLMQQHCTTR
jgi:hypothetical protein